MNGLFHQTYYSSHYAQAYFEQKPSSVDVHHKPSRTHGAGSHRCTYKNCTFTGSLQSLQVHRMDRHLIYPPGWNERKKEDDWDADPSLKGKPILIAGTAIVLDNPEVLQAWIADRKRRWPTAARVLDKKRKADEALARGQLSAQDLGLFASKRRRYDTQEDKSTKKIRVTPAFVHRVESSDSSDSSNDDQPPEVISSKQPSEPFIHPDPVRTLLARPAQKSKKASSRHFAPPPNLLRNLLAPEIQMTVSNLSQAIRFLVDNNFLQDVELKPGQAEGKLIEVLDKT